MEELTKEEVLHVAHLARIEVDEKDIEKYGHQLKQIMDEINKINEVKLEETDTLITPIEIHNVYRNDEPINESIDIKKNTPKTNGNYIEVERFINE
jgi:aspartyl-tRNA(Asn)/glutamyl-tRNA(Gln) amidotransferase subunit C